MMFSRWNLVLAALLVGACNPNDSDSFPPGKPPDDDQETGQEPDTSLPDTADTAESGQDTSQTPPTGEFDEPGDYADVGASVTNSIALDDVSEDSNKDQEFYLVLLNTGTSEAGYRIWYTNSDSADEDAKGPPAPWLLPPSPKQGSPVRSQAQPVRPSTPLFHRPEPMPELTQDDIAEAEDEFLVRSSYDDDTTYEVVAATLYALGSEVAIWVDNNLAIDYYTDCDDKTSLVESGLDAYGFSNCDLQEIADIVDTNIMVTLESYFGEVSDVNGDGRVAVLITPVLNTMSLTSSDEENWLSVVESYAEPSVDLEEFDSDTNPGSDEQEVIYVMAPDPYGFFNPLKTVDVEEYTSVTLAGQIAVVMEQLINYNEHIIKFAESGVETSAEETWLDTALGAVAADLTGFGAIFYDDAWEYLDAPHLSPLVYTDPPSSMTSTARGAQYLFARWLVDTYGIEILKTLVQTNLTGVDNITAAAGVGSFEILAVQWQVALLSTGVTDESGTPLVSAELYPPYDDASYIDAPLEPPDTPDPSVHYGANGYQTGINIHGLNLVYSEGTEAVPVENEMLRVLLQNTDHYTYSPGFPFYGFMEDGYSAQVVRLTNIPYARATLNIQSSSESIVGIVIRWNDPSEDEDLVEENIYSATDAQSLRLPALPTTGEPVYAIGELTSAGKTTIADADEDEEPPVVYDTDRWRLDLSDRTSAVRLVAWLDRQYADMDGAVNMEDPWMAIFPEDWVPTPTVTETNRGHCESADGAYFEYPNSMLEYLYYQMFLSTASGVTEPEEEGDTGEDTGTEESEDFDPVGSPPDSGEEVTLDCSNDFDEDGVLDADEPMPENVLQQVQVQQATLGVTDLVTKFNFDMDHYDKDEVPTRNMIWNLGGASIGDSEEAFLDIVLMGGQVYTLIVGDESGGTGVYEITLQEITD